MGRAPCCDKAKVKKGPWSPEEDAKLKAYIVQHGTVSNWIALPQKIGLKRCGKSCRLRWLNYLRPNIKHGGFTEEEDNIICSLYINIGSRWSIIAAKLPGRTDNDIKNYWNTRLKKKLFGKQQRKVAAARRSISFQSRGQRDHHHHHHGRPDNNSILFPESTTLVTSQIQTISSGVSPTNSPDYHYKPEIAAGLVMMNQDYHQRPVNTVDDDQAASIRNLPIKLGGGFSNDNPHQQPIANSLYPPIEMATPQNQLHAHSSSMVNSTCNTNICPHQLPTNIVVSQKEAAPDHNNMFVQEIENFNSAAFDYEFDGLELKSCLFGMEMVMNTSATTGISTPSTESTINSLGDMIMTNSNSLLVHPHQIVLPDYYNLT